MRHRLLGEPAFGPFRAYFRPPLEVVVLIKQPTIQVLGRYTKSKEPVLVRCMNCGRKWMPIPNTLLSGEGCPDCGQIKKAEKRKKTQEQYESELYALNSDFEVISDYLGSRLPIRVRCKVCGYEWSRIAIKLLERPVHKNMKKLHSKIEQEDKVTW